MLSVHTKRGGAAAKAGHDLELHVMRWEGTLDLEAGSAELSADGSSLRVQKGSGGMQKLGDDDKDNIHKTIDDEVLTKRNITFRSSSVQGENGHYRVDGEAALGGATQPLSFDVVVDGEAVSARATVTQSGWGMKPFSVLFGSLKVLDEIEIQLQSR